MKDGNGEPRAFSLGVHGPSRGEQGSLIEDSSSILATSSSYKVTFVSRHVAAQLAVGDTKIELRWNGKSVGECALDVIGPPPRRYVTEVRIWMTTTENNLDEGANLTYAVVSRDFQTRTADNKPRDGIPPEERISMPSTVFGHIPDDPDDRRAVDIKILDDKTFEPEDRRNYAVFVAYNNSKGEDRNWIGRLTAEAVLNDGSTMPVLSDTGDFEMGHHDNRTKIDRVVVRAHSTRGCEVGG